MKRVCFLLGIALGITALIVLGIRASSAMQRVDGRSAAQWLAFVEEAGQTVSYHAVGKAWENNKSAQFILDQGRAGQYLLQTTDAQGKSCTMGYDGQRIWYANKLHTSKMVADTGPSAILVHLAGRIAGTCRYAGRPAIRLVAQNGNTRKEITADRQTGVILAMNTYFSRRRVSEMHVEQIAYRDVVVNPCSLHTDDAMTAITPAQARAVLGRNILHPTWLPAGMTLAKMYHAPCCCDTRGMVVLRYSDGVSTLTLSEMRDCNCAMCAGCYQANNGDAIVETRTIGNITVTAVGTLDVNAMRRILGSLQ